MDINSFLVKPTMSDEIINKLIRNFERTMRNIISGNTNRSKLQSLTTIFIEYVLKNKNLSLKIIKLDLLPAFPLFLIPLSYYALTANHSFNHAALTYRALPLTLGLILSLLYLSYLNHQSKMVRKR
jgi:hypothetical protein